MVRLRSNRWYSSDGQGKSRRVVSSNVAGTRRVASLCFLLALVVMLMQKATDPKYVRNAFSALGVPFDRELAEDGKLAGDGDMSSEAGPVSKSSSATQLTAGTGPEAGEISSPEWVATCNDLVPRLFQDASNQQVLALSRMWFRQWFRQGGSPGGSPGRNVGAANHDSSFPLDSTLDAEANASLRDLAGQAIKQLEVLEGELQPASNENAGEWLKQLRRFRRELNLLWSQVGVAPGTDVEEVVSEKEAASEGFAARISDPFRSSLSRFLDQRLIGVMKDASPWTSRELTPFFRLLQRGQGRLQDQTEIDEEPPLIGTQQMEGELDVFRGKMVRFRGSVRRVEWVAPSRNDGLAEQFGIGDGYWSMWLRGDDGAAQPVAVYATQRIGKQLQRAVEDEVFPDVEVVGWVGKRLAYGSQAGVEVAPTLFAKSIIQFLPDAPVALGKPPEQLKTEFGWALGIGMLATAILLVPILSNWKRNPLIVAPRRRSSKQADKKSFGGSDSMKLFWFILVFIPPASGFGYQTSGSESLVPPWAEQAGKQTAGDDGAGVTGGAGVTMGAGVTPGALGASPDQALLDLLTERLNSAFQSQSSAELAAFWSGEAGIADPLLKTLHSLRQLNWPLDAATRNTKIQLADGVHVASVTEVTGWVRLAMPVALSKNQIAWYQRSESDQVVRLEVELDSALRGDGGEFLSGNDSSELKGDSISKASGQAGRSTLTVFSSQVPSSWLASGQLRQPVRMRGLIVESSVASDSRCMFIRHPIWVIPDSVDVAGLKPQIPDHWQRLGETGWDLSQIESVVRRDQQPLSQEEASAYFSLMARTSEMNLQDSSEILVKDPLEVLAKPAESFGKTVLWRVRLVTGSKVKVTNSSDQLSLGANFYYQYDGLVDIGNRVVRYGAQRGAGKEAGSKSLNSQASSPLKFEGEFPVTIVSKIPAEFDRGRAGEESGVNAKGDDRTWELRNYALVEGLFYRLWSYESTLTEREQGIERQAAPLVIAGQITSTLPPVREVKPPTGWFSYALCAVTILFLSSIVYLVVRKDKPRRRRSLRLPPHK